MGVSSYLCFRELFEMSELLINLAVIAVIILIYAWTVSNLADVFNLISRSGHCRTIGPAI